MFMDEKIPAFPNRYCIVYCIDTAILMIIPARFSVAINNFFPKFIWNIKGMIVALKIENIY